MSKRAKVRPVRAAWCHQVYAAEKAAKAERAKYASADRIGVAKGYVVRR